METFFSPSFGMFADKFGVGWMVMAEKKLKTLESEWTDHERRRKPKATEFVISRVLDAPRELVWKCFTEPEHMKQWWGPKGFKVVASKMDLRPAAPTTTAMKAPTAPVMWGKMVYREIAPPERIVFINSFSDEKGGVTRHPMAPTWPLEMLSVFTFEEQPGGKTKFTVRWSPHNPTEEERKTFDAGHASMKQGWSGTWNSSKPIWQKPRLASRESGARQAAAALNAAPSRTAIERRTHELRRWIYRAGAEEEARPPIAAWRRRPARSGAITARSNIAKASPTTSRSASGPRSRAA